MSSAAAFSMGGSPQGSLAWPSAAGCRVLLYSRVRDAAVNLGRTFEAFGARVRFCDLQSAFWEYLETGVWDIVIFDVERGSPPSAESLQKVRAAQPKAALWLLADVVSLPEDLRQLGQQNFIRIFHKPVTPDELLGAMPSRRGIEDDSPGEEALVLVVHPDPAFCEAITEFLSIEGHQSRCVRDGAEAAAEVRRQFYHMALVDTSVQDAAVWDLAQQMHEANPHLAVIALADYSSIEAVLAAMRADVFDYLQKPLDPFAFRRTLRKALEKQRLTLQIQVLLEGLRKANQDLFHLNELKSKFLRVVTHDLRTPLTSIKGYVQALNAGLIRPDQYKSSFATIVRESFQLEHLINDLMDFASMETGKLRLDRAPLKTEEFFRVLLDRFAVSAEKRGIRFTIQGLNDQLPELFADPRRLDQVLTNLVSNAFKHTSRGGSVTVSFIADADRLRVEVEDTGEGLSPDQLTKIFEEFYQVEGAVGQKEGLGLGLVIAREIVQRHGGEIGVASEGVCKGARFWFSIPFHIGGER